jgi:hypothetical protein
MWKSNKVADLLNKRHKIDKEIEDIQKGCPHFDRSVKSIRERLDSTTMVIRWVCDNCFKIVGYPSKKEAENYYN